MSESLPKSNNRSIQISEDEIAKYNKTFLSLNSSVTKKKLINKLLYRGWEPHMVYEKINDLIS
mgnify:CR=1 FL=1